MAISDAAALVQIDGENALVVHRLREPLSRALGNRRRRPRVQVEAVGRGGEVLVNILGHRGRVPLRFAPDELEPAASMASSGTPWTDSALEVVRATEDRRGWRGSPLGGTVPNAALRVRG